MIELIERLRVLWTTPLPADDDEAIARFGELYHQPVLINGVSTTPSELLARGRVLQGAFSDIELIVADVLEAPGGLGVSIRQRGRHTGVLPSPVGDLEPTGETFDVLSIDVLHVRDGRISEVWVLADDLTRLVQLHALPTPA